MQVFTDFFGCHLKEFEFEEPVERASRSAVNTIINLVCGDDGDDGDVEWRPAESRLEPSEEVDEGAPAAAGAAAAADGGDGTAAAVATAAVATGAAAHQSAAAASAAADDDDYGIEDEDDEVEDDEVEDADAATAAAAAVFDHRGEEEERYLALGLGLIGEVVEPTLELTPPDDDGSGKVRVMAISVAASSDGKGLRVGRGSSGANTIFDINCIPRCVRRLMDLDSQTNPGARFSTPITINQGIADRLESTPIAISKLFGKVACNHTTVGRDR